MGKSIVGVGLAAVAVGWAFCGCGPSTSEAGERGTTPSGKNESATEDNGPTADPSAVSAEKFEEIANYFNRKAAQLQYSCYNAEVEKTHQKFQGSVNITLVVKPGSKLERIRVNSSTLNSPGIEQCIVAEMKRWEWPEVPSLVPYQGSITFKPAW